MTQIEMEATFTYFSPPEGDESEGSDAALYDEIDPECTESLELYCKGGHHPVHLGDVLNGRYEVVHKIDGNGPALVWLCQDTVTNNWRSVRIMTAKHSAERREAQICGHLLRMASFKTLKKNHLEMPLDQFWIEGPNGRHHCSVLPALGPSVSEWKQAVGTGREIRMTNAARNVCAQIIQAVHFLHGSGVCHGNLRLDNVWMRLRDLSRVSKAEMLEIIGSPETCRIEPGLGMPPSPQAPNYVVLPPNPADMGWEIIGTNSVAIIDFSASFLAGDQRRVGGLSPCYAAPELIWPNTFRQGRHSDVWSLGTIIYQMARCGPWPMFGDFFDSGNTGKVVEAFELFLGGLPQPYRDAYLSTLINANQWGSPILYGENRGNQYQNRLIDEAKWAQKPIRWNYDDLLITREEWIRKTGFSDYFEAALRIKRRFFLSHRSESSKANVGISGGIRYAVPREDVIEIADLVRKMLRYDPAKRIDMDKVINHPWVRRCALLRSS